MKNQLGIYIHIPFCVRKCGYCDFLSAPAGEETQRQYIRMLRQEIRGSSSLGESHEVSTVFFGGGTPSVLPEGSLTEILEELRACFSVRADAEITVECNPGTLTGEKLGEYTRAGVNRLSIGLQSSKNRELALLGRIHTWEEFLESFWLARERGFDNLNVDLMSALPGQTCSSWIETLEQVIALSPEHISAYSLILEEGTPFYERYREGADDARDLPDEDVERQMYYDTGRILGQAGYERYEISNYAKPGFACRHNLSCWERKEYRGFGIGAASLVGEVRFRNHSSLTAYCQGDFTHEEVQRLTRKEQLEETMFLGLRKMEGVVLSEELLTVYETVFQDLERKGLLIRSDSRVFLTERGIDVSNYALAEFLLGDD